MDLRITSLATCTTEDADAIVKEQLQLETVDLEQLKTLGFRPLIGDSLEGWNTNLDSPQAKYTLNNGVISGVSNKLKNNTWLYTTEEFSDFLLYFEFRFDDMSGNSGLMYRSAHKDEKYAGLQYEMDNAVHSFAGTDYKRQWTGLLYAENAGGWQFPKPKSPKSEKNKLSQEGHKALDSTGWNAAFIRARGSDIQTWLNKQIRVNFTIDNPDAPVSGAIALQLHRGHSCAVSWRNIYILPLK